MHQNLIDRIIGAISPRRAVARARRRKLLSQLIAPQRHDRPRAGAVGERDPRHRAAYDVPTAHDPAPDSATLYRQYHSSRALRGEFRGVANYAGYARAAARGLVSHCCGKVVTG